MFCSSRYILKQLGGQLNQSSRTINPNNNQTNNITTTTSQDLIIKYDFSQVNQGNLLGQLETATPPLIYYPEDLGKGPYTLILVDPDSPDPKDPIYKEWIQWMIVNIPGNQINLGRTVLPYQPPIPPRGTHRYIFYLYDQQGTELPPNISYPRQGFNRALFLWQYKLAMNPLAINYFRVESLNPDDVPLNL